MSGKALISITLTPSVCDMIDLARECAEIDSVQIFKRFAGYFSSLR